MAAMPTSRWECRLFECKDNGQVFKWKNNCINHIIYKHLLIKWFYCLQEGCNETFLRADHAKAHCLNDHRDASAFEDELLNLAFYACGYIDNVRDSAHQLAEDLLPLCEHSGIFDLNNDPSRKLRALLQQALYYPLARVVGQEISNNPDIWKLMMWNNELANEASKILESRIFANGLKQGGLNSRLRLRGLLCSLAVNNCSSLEHIRNLSRELHHEHCATKNSLLRSRLRGYTDALTPPIVNVENTAGTVSGSRLWNASANSFDLGLMDGRRLTWQADMPSHVGNEDRHSVLSGRPNGIVPSQSITDAIVPNMQLPSYWHEPYESGPEELVLPPHPPLRLLEFDGM